MTSRHFLGLFVTPSSMTLIDDRRTAGRRAPPVAPATGMTPLIDKLVEHGHEFSFVQVMRLGDPSTRLGLNMWCFSDDILGEVNAEFRMAALPEI